MRTQRGGHQENGTSHVIWGNWLYFCKAAHVHKTTSWQVDKLHTYLRCPLYLQFGEITVMCAQEVHCSNFREYFPIRTPLKIYRKISSICCSSPSLPTTQQNVNEIEMTFVNVYSYKKQSIKIITQSTQGGFYNLISSKFLSFFTSVFINHRYKQVIIELQPQA